MQERPRDLFDRVFGNVLLSDAAPDERQARLRRSVPDSIVGQYIYYTGSYSPLGAQSRARLADHLDRIREYEQRAFGQTVRNPIGPQLPPPSRMAHGGYADPGGEGIDIALNELTRVVPDGRPLCHGD